MKTELGTIKQQEELRSHSIGERVKARMKELNIERKDLAKHAKCSVQFLSQMFKDPNAGVGADTLFRMAEKLEVTERWLQYEQGPMKRPSQWQLDALEILEGLPAHERDKVVWILDCVKRRSG